MVNSQQAVAGSGDVDLDHTIPKCDVFVHGNRVNRGFFATILFAVAGKGDREQCLVLNRTGTNGDGAQRRDHAAEEESG